MVANGGRTRRWGADAALGIALALALDANGATRQGPPSANVNQAKQAPPATTKQVVAEPQLTTPTPGATQDHPVYVNAGCERGCGYVEDKGWWGKFSSDPNALFGAVAAMITAGLLAVAIIQAVIFNRQAALMRRTLGETRLATRAANKSVAAAQRSAEAAVAAVAKSEALRTHAEKSTEMELRAYVFVELYRFDTKELPRLPSAFEGMIERTMTTGDVGYRYRNFGKTPAKNVRCAARAVLLGPDEAADLSQIGDAFNLGPLAPGDFFDDKVEIEGLAHGMDAKAHVDDGKAVHVFGRIEYVDAFSQSRWTTFHAYVGGDTEWDVDFDLATATTGNDYY